MPKWMEPIRTTVIGGVIFMIPLFVVGYVFAKVLGLLGKIVQPVVSATGLTSIGGVTTVTIVTVLLMALIAYLSGLLAATSVGQRFLRWIEGGVVSMIPSFNVLEGLAKSVDSKGSNVLVVLVPTDAGWALGLVFEPPRDDWYAVFLPGSPQWTSGSLSYAHARDVRILDIPMASVVMILARRGPGSERIYAHLGASRQDVAAPAAASSDAA